MWYKLTWNYRRRFRELRYNFNINVRAWKLKAHVESQISGEYASFTYQSPTPKWLIFCFKLRL